MMQRHGEASAESSSQPPELCEEALHPLARRVRGALGGAVGLQVSIIFFQLELNQEIDFRAGQQALGNASIEEVAERGMSFEGLFRGQRGEKLSV